MKLLRCSYLIAVVMLGFVLVACNLTPAANPTLPIHTAHVTVNGKTEVILTDARGFALYYYPPDTATSSACTGDCANDWPPLLQHGSAAAPLSAGSLPGSLTLQQTANGNQIEYNGHLLYTYIGDTSARQVTGDNVNNWFVATPALS